jgi:hypothetical protein
MQMVCPEPSKGQVVVGPGALAEAVLEPRQPKVVAQAAIPFSASPLRAGGAAP